MSLGLVRHWRRLARVQEQAVADAAFPSSISAAEASNLRGYAEALRRCADSLERSLQIAARKKRDQEGGK